MKFYASVEQVFAEARESWRPPPKLTLSQWADERFYLSAESSAAPGRWKCLPYQVGILDAITDPDVVHVSVIKSARVGYTKCMDAAIGYYIDQDPSSILVVQPTIDSAKLYSKEEIEPMLRDVPALHRLTYADAEETSGTNTILHKRFPGGVLSMVGANSGTGFRMISRRVVIFDEVDAYPASAGNDGDPIKLGTTRADQFWNRKIIAGSTPLIEGTSRISQLFEQGDQRRYFVPCPQCGHMAPFVFTGEAGHSMKWPKDKPEEAFFSCQANGCAIEHKDKRAMVIAGEWRAAKPFTGHASFHIWAAYSFSPNATWGQLAAEFVTAKENNETLRTFVNTVLGETWKERGDAPAWAHVYASREEYKQGTVPAEVKFITAGVDVQKDRWVYEVVGWGDRKQSWSIDAGVIAGNTSDEADWTRLDELLDTKWPSATGVEMGIRMLAVDSGAFTQSVYAWARNRVGRVIAIKGQSSAKTLISSPTAVDVKVNGKKVARGGGKVWPVGVDIGKAELYGWLRLERPPEGHPFPGGYCHFPQYGEDYFKQLTAEHLVTSKTKQGFLKQTWEIIPGRENHWLDARIYARAAAGLLGLDSRMKHSAPPPPAPVAAPDAVAGPPVPRPAPVVVAPKPRPPKRGPADFRFRKGNGKGWLR